MVFDPKKYLIKVNGGKQYLPVSARLLWMREEHPDWGITTELLQLDVERQFAVFHATVTDNTGRQIGSGTNMESVKGFPDYLEKCETSAIGRALATAGYGTQFAPELDEGRNHYADAPQQQRGGYGNAPRQQAPTPENAPACSACGRELTISQVSFSTGKFGVPLCPTCQKEHGAPEHGAPQAPPHAAAAPASEPDPFAGTKLPGTEPPAPTSPQPSLYGDRSAAQRTTNKQYACADCGVEVTEPVRRYSIEKYGAVYCRSCQPAHEQLRAA